MDVLLRTVFGHIRRDQWDQALALLQASSSNVSENDAEFWRLLGQVAWELRDYAASEQAYLRSARAQGGEPGDWTRLVFLARQKDPQAAAELAMQAYRRFGTAEQLHQALSLYAEIGDVAAQARIYRSLTFEQRALAEQNAQFLLVRAQFYQGRNQGEAALNDLRRARLLAPQDEVTVQALLWFLISEQRRPELIRILSLYRQKALDNPDYWLVFAAANQTLGRYRDAMAWYRKAIAANPQDALLLLNYADALDQVHQSGMADRVRRHAWQLVKDKYPRRPQELAGLGSRAELQAWARLTLRNPYGDRGQQLAQHLARQLRGITADAATENQIDVLLLGWAALKEQNENAKGWLFQRYGAQSRGAPPLWIEAMVAQQERDTARMTVLLDRRGQAMDGDVRYELALALDQTALALDTAQQGMNQPELAEANYERFRQLAPRNAHYVQLRAFSEDLDILKRQGTQLEGRWVIDPNLHAVLGWSRVSQSSADPDFATLAPGTDKLDSVELRWIGADHEERITLLQRSELTSLTGLRLQHTAHALSRLDYEVGLDFRNESIMSVPLRVAGYENSVYADVTYNLDRRNYLRAAPRWSRYFTQYGDELGSGRILEAEAGHRLRVEYPDWRVRAYAVAQDYTHDGSISADSLARLPAYLQTGIGNGSIDGSGYFVPQSNSTVGACVTMGDNRSGQSLQNGFSRAWLPFMDLCLRHNTVSGDGYTGLLGMAGSITGSDHLVVQWQGSDVAVPGSTALRSLSIRYRRYF
jgi:polysaccharide biosynthesis protein PelB